MGNTVRRQSISFKIPDTPDYEFLNITDFRGLNISDNPFTVNYNTASDCLNVYVDESNALTTRPRLEVYKNFTSSLPSGFEHLYIYNLSDGFLIHGKVGTTYYMYKYVTSTNTLTRLTGNVPTTKCKVFEEQKVVYILDGVKMRYVYNTTIRNLENYGYIPTTRIGITSGNEGSSHENYNVLSPDYKETAIWDGTWDLDNIGIGWKEGVTSDEKGYDYDNNYIISTQYDNNGPIILSYLPEYLPDSVDNYFLTFKSYSTSGSPNIKCTMTLLAQTDEGESDTTDFSPISDILGGTTHYCDNIVSVSSNDGQYIFSVWFATPETYSSHSSETNAEFGGVATYSLYKILGQFNPFQMTYDEGETPDVFVSDPASIYDKVTMSQDGTRAVVLSDSNIIVYSVTYNATYQPTITRTRISRTLTINNTTYYCNRVRLSGDGDTLLTQWYTSKNVVNDCSYLGRSLNLKTTSSPTITTFAVGSSDDYYSQKTHRCEISYDGTMIACPPYRHAKIDYVLLYNNFKTSTDYEKILISHNVHTSDSTMRLVFDKDSTKLYYYNGFMTSGWIDMSIKKAISTYYTDSFNQKNSTLTNDMSYPDLTSTDEDFYNPVYGYATSNSIMIFGLGETGGVNIPVASKFVFDYDYDVTDDKLILYKELKEGDSNYQKRLDLLNVLNQARLTISFQNERWFGSGSNVYRTENGDMSYIPMIEYQVLGDGTEDITGFNLVEDEILIAYKPNRLYSIVPDDTYSTFIRRETKNTVGNDGFDSPIVTTLTETSTQICYDGIFALNQLENVQSSDRISVLMSEGINKKWLQEDNSVIAKTITFNRLYWTYYVLPYSDKTKIYLLDNRTSSWYYWELPIVTTNAYNKDNESIFVASDGTIYRLKTDDIVHAYNPNLTEYYDFHNPSLQYDTDAKLIDWKWKSQILPLGTINYFKKLDTTTFILADTDSSDEYSLNYKFTVYRKLINETNQTTISNKLNYVQSTTKRTPITRFNFIQLELSNTEDDTNNNKFRLIGVGLKYELLEGVLS